MLLLRHRPWLTGFLAASTASMLVACGGKVVVDAGGAPGGGGAAPATSSVGSDGAGGFGSTGSTGGTGGCEGLQADLMAKLAAAQACNPALSVPQCNGGVAAVDICGCTVVANDTSAAAAQSATTAFETWVGAGCGPLQCLYCPPGPGSPWYCDPTTAVCKPAFEK
jgi:hypothetical protein